MTIASNYAFVVNANNTLTAWNISNPAAPSLSATIATGTGSFAVTVADNYAYVVNQSGYTMQVYKLFCPNMITMDPVTVVSPRSRSRVLLVRKELLVPRGRKGRWALQGRKER
ncbi:MAG: hypothetical protein IPG74_16605 [Flavobacteriales bacterium]|nr:hypothetical protein [Flavobacteriales bacterium]